jgi:hypothetical protein
MKHTVIGFWIMKSGEVSFYFVTFVQQTLTILSVSSIPACELYVISSSKFNYYNQLLLFARTDMMRYAVFLY